LELDHGFSAQAERLKNFLDALGIEKCHLGGNSMGGAIALRFALDFPERLMTLTLLDNAGVSGTEESELQRSIVEGETPLVPRTMADVDRLLAMVTVKPPFIPTRFKQVMLKDMKHQQKLLDKVFAQVADEGLNHPLNDRLKEITVPTQIIWGRQDRLIDVTCAVVQHEGIRDSELVILDGVGHVPMIEKPALTAEHQLAFLVRH
jgi:pimeloyl-ACP methyl ester carboxylesterase